jgi:large subunit ribosomal protein L13
MTTTATATANKPKKFKTYMAKPGEVARKWYVVDAAGVNLGRLAVKIAMRLAGKDKPTYTPYADAGDFVVVINAEKIGIHPRKVLNKKYRHWSGYLGGLKERTFAEVQKKDPRKPLMEAVRKMLPKNLLAKQLLTKLKVYAGAQHPHAAQQPEKWEPLPRKQAAAAK